MTPRQRLFVREYLRDLNATRAAIRAGYSKASATTEGPRLLDNAGVRQAIDSALADRELRVEAKADEVLRELLAFARTDIRDAFDENGRLLAVHEMPEHVAKAISSVKVFEEFEGAGKDRVQVGEVREVKFWDKSKALELLGRHLKMFAEKHEFEAGDKLMQLLGASTKKPEELATEISKLSPEQQLEVARGERKRP